MSKMPLLGFMMMMACSSGGSASLGFTPSNVDLTGLDLSTIGDFVVDNNECTIDTDSNLASCGDGARL